jgi:predicted nucleic acid-binding Zn ribbon protein
METKEEQKPAMTTEQVLQEILENSRKTKRYMAWQFYITIVLIVIPILAMAFLLPMALKSLGGAGSVYLNGLQ